MLKVYAVLVAVASPALANDQAMTESPEWYLITSQHTLSSGLAEGGHVPPAQFFLRLEDWPDPYADPAGTKAPTSLAPCKSHAQA